MSIGKASLFPFDFNPPRSPFPVRESLKASFHHQSGEKVKVPFSTLNRKYRSSTQSSPKPPLSIYYTFLPSLTHSDHFHYQRLVFLSPKFLVGRRRERERNIRLLGLNSFPLTTFTFLFSQAYGE